MGELRQSYAAMNYRAGVVVVGRLTWRINGNRPVDEVLNP